MPLQEDPNLLVEPNHVILNHLYALSIKVRERVCIFVPAVIVNGLWCLLQDNVLVLAATHRFQQKYITTLVYKPI